MVSDGNYLVITVLNFKFIFPWLAYAWSYLMISLPFMTSKLVTLTFLLGDLFISTGGLVVHKYFLKVQHISLPFMTVRFGKLPHL